jgi:hypothetical protein
MTSKHKKDQSNSQQQSSFFLKHKGRQCSEKKASEILEEKQLMDEVWRSPYFTPSAE